MEDKHRSITDVFRFLDQRGKGKVKKSDFVSAVERMRISLAREDVTKVWNYIDGKGQGWISMPELSAAYASRVSNFSKTVEAQVERNAVQTYKQQPAAEAVAKESPYRHPSPKLMGGPGPYKGLHTQRMPGTDRAGPGRSPLVRKSIEHTFGSKNLPSDEIGKIV